MTTEFDAKMVSRRRMLPFLGLAAAVGLASDTPPPRHTPPAWRDVKSGAEGA